MPFCSTLRELAHETWAHMHFQLAHGFRAPDERAFTDHHMIEMAIRHYPKVQTRVFTGHEEAKTGADFEWWVGDGQTFVAFLGQAKKLDRADRYSQLGKKIGRGRGVRRQIDLLIDVCTVGTRGRRGTKHYIGYVPIYVLYNGPSAVNPTFPSDRCTNSCLTSADRGCMVARAQDVRQVFDHPTPSGHDGLDSVAPIAWPWYCLFCCDQQAPSQALQERVARFLSGEEGEDGRWISGSFDVEGFPRLWSLDEVPLYVRLLATGDLPPGEESVAEYRTGARQVTVFQSSAQYL